MTPCEQEILTIFVRSCRKKSRIHSRRLKKIAKRAGKDKNARVRRWNARRINYTMLVLEAMRDGECSERFARMWFVPLLHYIELLAVIHPKRGKALRHYFHAFAETHGFTEL